MIRALLLSILLAATPLAAQAEPGPSDVTGWSVGGGIGFIASPGQFLLQLDAPYRLSKLISVGPTFQLGASGSRTTVNASLDGKIHLPVFERSSNAFFGKLTPYFGVGVGFSHYNRSNRSDESNLLIPVLTGAEFELTDQIALTSDMRFNIAATSDIDTFFFSWQMIGVRYRF
jgi:hypothetical protein